MSVTELARVVSDRVVERRRAVIVATLLVTAVFGLGMTMVEESTSVDDFQSETPQTEALDTVAANFTAQGSNTTTAQVVVEGENVLDRSTMLEILAFQAAIRDDPTVERTLTDDAPTAGVANAVAIDAYVEAEADELEARADDLEERGDTLNETAESLGEALETSAWNPSRTEAEFRAVDEESPVNLTDEHLATFEDAVEEARFAGNESEREAAAENGTVGVLGDEYDQLEADAEALSEERDALAEEAETLPIDDQRDQLESLNASEYETAVERVLGEDARDDVLALLPASYEPGSTTAPATVVTVTHDTGGELVTSDTAPEEIVAAQLAVQEEASTVESLDVSVVGHGITTHEIGASTGDSLSVVGPIALVFVLTVLSIAYRDPVDVALGMLGVGLVLVWTLGFMGLVGIDFTVVFVGVVVLLIGLSIDFAIHLVMRIREARLEGDGELTRATTVGLAGVGVALLAVTLTTAFGFLSNLVSSIGPIQEFGLVSAVGIVSAFVVFAVFLPAIKTDVDAALERAGYDRRRRAFGTGDRLGPLLSGSARLASHAPAVLVGALLVTAAAGVGMAHVETSFGTEEFLPEEAPDWVESVPFAPETESYTAAATLGTLDDHFVRQDRRTDVLVEADPTDPETLERVADGERRLGDSDSVATLANDEPARVTPLSVIDDVAAENESFATTVNAADTTGDGVPDTDLEAVYDELYAADEAAASQVVSRSADGEYGSLRLSWFGDGESENAEIAAEAGAVADAIDGQSVTATETGQDTVVAHQIELEIVETVVQTFLVTLVAISVLLLLVFKLTAGAPSLGLVTIFPVTLVLAWIFATMAVLDIPLNFITAMIASLTIGLGVDYSIHVTERYHQELESVHDPWTALERTVTGTGGALLGSATTTAAGFGVLAFAFLPALQYFGIIAALSIVYAFLASVVVLPSALAVWTGLFGPEEVSPSGDATDVPELPPSTGDD